MDESFIKEVVVDGHLGNVPAYGILDSVAEKELDTIARLASSICNTAYAFITFTHGDLLVTRASVGFGPAEVPLDKSICQYTVRGEEVFEVADTLEDGRFSGHAAVVQEPFIRYYAGAPLITPQGDCLGAICVADTIPGSLTDLQKTGLQILAQKVISHLELSKKTLQLEETLAKYEDIHQMFDSSAEIHCILDEKGRVLMANKALEKLLGHKIEDCLGKPIWEFIVEDDVYRLMPVINGGLSSGKRFFELEARIEAKDGAHKWMGWTVSVNERKWFANGRDISFQKRVTEQLEQLSVVASRIDNGVIISNAANVIWVNDAFEKITGYNISDLQGRRLGDILKGKDTDEGVILKARELTKNKQSFVVDLLGYRKDGRPIWLSVMNSVILNAAGEIEKEIEIITDISERKKAELELEVLSLVASETSSGVLIRDPGRKIIWVNSAFEDMLGYTCDDLIGNYIRPLITGEETDRRVIEVMDKALAENRPFNVDLLSYRKDRTPVWLHISHNPILNEDGSLERSVEIITDINERKIAEQELIKTREEAVQLGKAKEQLLSVMSHEIRTPLNAVIGMTHLLIDDNPSPSQLENLNILKFSAENLLTLINDILDFTKIETGNMVLEKIDVNLKELVSYTLSSFQFKAVEKGIIIKSEIDYRIPELVKGDHTRLYQILINLLGNAVKFTSEGEIKLKLDLVEETKDTVDVRFEVSDTGIGIPEDKIDAIFDAFTQAGSDTARKFGGTGLGLAITKSLLKLLDADIAVESVLGQGTKFSFIIRFESSMPTSGAMPVSNTKPQLSSVILIVDDNQINRLLANKVLTKWGATTDYAEDGHEAVEKVRSNRYDLVLMDIHMPVMDGLEAAKMIRSIDGDYFRDLPIVALTASILSNDLNKIYEAGMNDFVLKPFTPDSLFDKIRLYVK